MSCPSRQRGAALLLLLVIAVLVFTTAVLSGYGKWSSAATTSRNVNGQALAQAKAALIGYVAKEVLDLSENVPGRLPCPEAPGNAGTTNEGTAAGNCGSAVSATRPAIGRLPWRTLGVDKLVDASAEPLWYAVSPKWVTLFQIPPVPPTINAGTAGDITFDGTADVVAIIFAAGGAISTSPTFAQLAAGCAARNQVRGDRSHVASGGDPDYRDYLECQNADATLPDIDTTFGVAVADNDTNLVINDQAVVITSKDVLNAIQGPVAERMQRTVAPLLSEYSTLWPGGTFLPYAVTFATPESNLAVANHCGPSASVTQTGEGLLPIAPNSAPCVSDWTSFSISGSVTSLGCAASPVFPKVRCQFHYYILNGLGQLLFGAGAGSTDATIQATAPHASASFRKPLANSDVTIVSGTATVQSTTLVPQTDGDARMSLVVRVTGTNLCDNTLLGLVCSLLGGLLTTNQTVQVDFPQLGTPTLPGTMLTTAAKNGRPGPFDLLNPAVPGAGGFPNPDPHYWFMQNQWYRYTYYAVSPNASAAASGGNLTVNGFPTANGSINDKRFVLAVMGPAVTGQARGGAATLGNYVEGDNAASTAVPRVFAYQVFSLSGNDRIATCPFDDGSVPCN